MYQPFQDFLQRAASRYGISKEMEAAGVCHSFKKLIPEIFEGKEGVESYISAGFYKNHQLVINVENQAWGQEVMMRKERIIEEMNQKAGKKIIANLRVQLKR